MKPRRILPQQAETEPTKPPDTYAITVKFNIGDDLRFVATEWLAGEHYLRIGPLSGVTLIPREQIRLIIVKIIAATEPG